ncbi:MULTISPECIES: hypothetical protein [Escherichia]|uniref:hypothetical protein n=1 Tax=Escherichia TaxID=561 RepID=UPI0012FFA143|nr:MULTISPECIES: hypothetical protein [Escherichia]EMB9094482.1 hypothetical protein [Escherichia coli]EMD1585532.1 hypothetical protein [Escherichia coli]MBB7312001.1 hypothetical protein [Escherichia coli]MBB8621796.1 hypothetical protein [Escherichia coli]MCO0538101.1 hypothetical protein [Escherichia coli]
MRTKPERRIAGKTDCGDDKTDKTINERTKIEAITTMVMSALVVLTFFAAQNFIDRDE